MTDATLTLPAPTVGDYVQLLKPRVMSLVVFTGLVGLMIAPGTIHPLTGMVALLCIAIGAGASGALNMAYDADIDRVMARTAGRPIPAGKITAEAAAEFGWVLSALSVMVMAVLVGYVAAALLAFTIFFYVVVYTLWLKRWTTQNIVIGGLAGALPPVIGWAAVTGEAFAWPPLVLVALIFLWTPPHFWALAILTRKDYAAAGVPMLPVVVGERETQRQILLYTAVTVPFGMLPVVMGFGGWLYAAIAGVSGLLFLYAAWRLHRAGGERVAGEAKRVFGFSILYLFLVFTALLVERLAAWSL